MCNPSRSINSKTENQGRYPVYQREDKVFCFREICARSSFPVRLPDIVSLFSLSYIECLWSDPDSKDGIHVLK